jgi:hypothetical protein
MNDIAPSRLACEVPTAAASIGGKSIVIFPERSDNGRLNDELFSDFIRRAIGRGLKSMPIATLTVTTLPARRFRAPCRWRS